MAPAAVAQQPDIAYAPDLAKYQARSKYLAANESQRPSEVPAGFPKRLVSDLVWEGKDLAKDYEWVHELTTDEIREVEDALAHFKSLNKSLGHISQETFPLAKLHAVLRGISTEIHHGHGFKIVRGLPVHRHSREDNIILGAGLSSHVAPIRGRQDSKFDGRPADVMISHIKDLSATSSGKNVGAPAYTTDKQVFHTDAGDIVALFALSTAAAGGTSRLASTYRVYNELAATRPDIIHTLSENWTAEIVGTPGENVAVRPLLYFQPATSEIPERMILQYARRNFTGFGALPRSSDIPPITEAQAEALDTLHFLGERFNLGLDFRQGDIQLVNNLALFHARDGFTDTAEQQRHLVRFWLRDPENAWATPEPLKKRWDNLYKELRPESQVFPLEPFIRSASNAVEKSK